jgi:phage replication initiation protein
VKLIAAVDWLNFTGENTGDVYPREVAYPIGGKLMEAKSLHGYTNATENELGTRVMWHSTRKDMGVHVMYSGGTLNNHLDNGIEARTIAAHHKGRGDRCTRIDVAIDAVDSNLSIRKLYDLSQASYKLPFGRKATLMQSGKGVTLYVGSRTSELFLRVYDKGAEQGTDDNWKRVELEMKGTRAGFFVNVLVNDGLITIGGNARAVIKGMADFDDRTWQTITGDEPLTVGKGERRETDTKEWLLTQVAPAMGRYLAKTGDKSLTEQFWAVVSAFSGDL